MFVRLYALATKLALGWRSRVSDDVNDTGATRSQEGRAVGPKDTSCLDVMLQFTLEKQHSNLN